MAKKSHRPKKDGGSMGSWRFAVVGMVLALGIAWYVGGGGEPRRTPYAVSSSLLDSPLSVELPCIHDGVSKNFTGCSPTRCGRLVTENLVSPSEAQQLVQMFEQGISYGGGGKGGPTILDMASGAVSSGTTFIDAYAAMESRGESFREEDVAVYSQVLERVRQHIEQHWGGNKLHFTSPQFFSRIKSTSDALIMNDEYWHTHVDSLQYPGFAYTALVYLNQHGKEYEGGRFVFTSDKEEKFVEPVVGRSVMFTSGSENPHRVEKVESGTRYALTISFTCDPTKALAADNISRRNKRS